MKAAPDTLEMSCRFEVGNWLGHCARVTNCRRIEIAWIERSSETGIQRSWFREQIRKQIQRYRRSPPEFGFGQQWDASTEEPTDNLRRQK